jgi:hypothetical protein
VGEVSPIQVGRQVNIEEEEKNQSGGLRNGGVGLRTV